MAAFAQRLRDLRPPEMTFDLMAKVALCSKPTLAAAAAGRKMPTWSVTCAYLTACGVSEDEREVWQQEHAIVAREHQAWTRREAGGGEGAVEASRLPGPEDVRTAEDFARALDGLRQSRGLSFRDMERRARMLNLPRALPFQTAHDALKNGRPSEHTLRTILAVCRVPGGDRAAWLDAWRRVVAQADHDRAVARAMHVLGRPSDPAEHNKAIEMLTTAMAAYPPDDPRHRSLADHLATLLTTLYPRPEGNSAPPRRTYDYLRDQENEEP
ncbi:MULTISPECIES: helix-turn-helix domain-containing protein [Pseudofrankia]|uniref:helix-turn-helix domain-containing protein n=1 Tax=Pseudofrankia TaxID=2994363 RepID=UPI000234B795|nr:MULTISPECIES: helix-turn-helix domain-containing protein [Pseudofrankia]OHV29004.1 hypothetical protein BCD49_36785 [Pseudofrankia sp. EUN1h]